jgi:hypothetical protein
MNHGDLIVKYSNIICSSTCSQGTQLMFLQHITLFCRLHRQFAQQAACQSYHFSGDLWNTSDKRRIKRRETTATERREKNNAKRRRLLQMDDSVLTMKESQRYVRSSLCIVWELVEPVCQQKCMHQCRNWSHELHIRATEEAAHVCKCPW